MAAHQYGIMWLTPAGTPKQSSDAYVEDIIKNPDDYRVLERIPICYDDIPIDIAEL